MGPIWGPPGSCRPQMGPMLAPWTLLSGKPSNSQLQGGAFFAKLGCFPTTVSNWRWCRMVRNKSYFRKNKRASKWSSSRHCPHFPPWQQLTYLGPIRKSSSWCSSSSCQIQSQNITIIVISHCICQGPFSVMKSLLSRELHTVQWASYQICKIASCACARNARNVFPATDFKGSH